MQRIRLSLFVTAGLLAGCVRGSSGESAPDASATPVATAVTKSSSDPPSTVIDFTKMEGACTVGHRGTLLDLGDATMKRRISGGKMAVPDAETREHEGASWLGVRARQLELSFVSPAEVKVDAGVIVEARLRGGAGKNATVFLNGKPLGTLALTKGETKIAAVRAPGVILRGTNELMLRFSGGTRGAHDELAEIDWIRVGPNDGDAPYAAPTRTDAVATVSINGTSRRGVSLRAPGFARCTTFVPNGSVLEGAIGVSGGEAEAEVRVLVDRAEPRVVGSFHLGGPGDPPGFRPVALPLGDIGTLAAVELVAKTSTKGARVVFAEPRVVAPVTARPASAVAPKARGVVLVVFGELPRRQLSLYGGSLLTPELAELANGGVVFDGHRASSSLASGALGSMLTGLSPREHGAADHETVLAPGVFTIAEAARQAGVVTAMFTANPTTTSVFGFARGWETFVTHLPNEEAPATSIFDETARWLEAHKNDRFLVVVHARGGHPPWDITSEELKELPPANYMGSLEPKHAGEALAKARRAGGGRLFSDPDRERAFALHAKAVAAHDAALGRLVAHVKSLGRDKDTVFIATGDVGVDAAARVPFLDDDTLDEGALALPLVIRGPEAAAHARVATATSSVDVARTILQALSLEPPKQLRGDSLFALAAAGGGSERALLANTSTRFSTRWAGFALVGSRERELRLCDIALDADCVSDVRATHPLAAEALHGLVYDELVEKPAAPVSVRPATDPPMTSALRAWGR